MDMTKKQFLGIVFIFLLFATGCSREVANPINTSPIFQTPSNASNISIIQNNLNNLSRGICPSFSIDKNEKLYNITGFVLSETHPNSTIYLAPTISTTLKISLQVPRECFIYWQTKITVNKSFRFNQVPIGKYVLFINGSSYTNSHGPPLPHKENDQGYLFLFKRSCDKGVAVGLKA
jgi:hypothetical protein